MACSYSPAPNVDVASTAGAGDCLLGGVLAALAAGIALPSQLLTLYTTPVVYLFLERWRMRMARTG